jgi:hypothetical protein
MQHHEFPRLIGMTIAYSSPGSPGSLSAPANPSRYDHRHCCTEKTEFPRSTNMIACSIANSVDDGSLLLPPAFGSPQPWSPRSSSAISSSDELNYSKDEYDSHDDETDVAPWIGGFAEARRTLSSPSKRHLSAHHQPRMVSILASSSPEITALCKSYLRDGATSFNRPRTGRVARATAARHTLSPRIPPPLRDEPTDNDSVGSSSSKSTEFLQRRPPLAPPPPPPPMLNTPTKVPLDDAPIPGTTASSSTWVKHSRAPSPVPRRNSRLERDDSPIGSSDAVPACLTEKQYGGGSYSTEPARLLLPQFTPSSSSSSTTDTTTLRRLMLHRRVSIDQLPPWLDICSASAVEAKSSTLVCNSE